MNALIREQYGVLEVKEIEKPEVPEDGVLVRVRAASINAVDRYDLMGTPLIARFMGAGLRKPKDSTVSADFAGVVEAAGPQAADVKQGDEVFGRTPGLGEWSVATKFGRKPDGLSFEDAAAIPAAGITALQGLRDKGALQAGRLVLINGASGGVGTYAVQIAKLLGGDVTAVCSTPNVQTAHSLGADRVIDYTKDDFSRLDVQHDLFFDVAGSRPWRAVKRVVKTKGTIMLVGGPKDNRLLGPLSHILPMKLRSWFDGRTAIFFIANPNRADLETLGGWAAEGKIRSVIDRRYALDNAADAFRYLDEGHARGKIVLTL